MSLVCCTEHVKEGFFLAKVIILVWIIIGNLFDVFVFT